MAAMVPLRILMGKR